MSLATRTRHISRQQWGPSQQFSCSSPPVYSTRFQPAEAQKERIETVRLTLAVSQVLQGLLVTHRDSSGLDDQGELGVDGGGLLGGLGLSGGSGGHFLTVLFYGVGDEVYRPVTRRLLRTCL